MTTTTALDRVHDALSRAGCSITNGGRAAQCPAHEDRAPSLSLGTRDDRAGVLVNCHAGCSVQDILDALALTPADLFDEPRARAAVSPSRSREVARYPYVDEDGVVLYEKVRLVPKSFRQRRPDRAGGWLWSLGDARRVLYNLPAVREAIDAGSPVYVCEGEKDADAVTTAGGCGTTWTEGAWKSGSTAKWRPTYTEQLAGARVVIVQDRDEPGRQTASCIAAELQDVATTVAVVEPAEGKDAADHLAAGRSLSDLVPVTEADGSGGTDVPPAAEGNEAEQTSQIAAEAPGASWRAVDLSAVVAGLEAGTLTRPEPTVGRMSGGGCLFYAGKVNGLAGASGSGKSWTALVVTAQELMAGRVVVYVDLEDDEVGVVGRLLDLAVPAEVILERCVYVHPDEALSAVAAETFASELDRVRPALVVIDSTGESMALDGSKPNDDDDVARWFRRLPTPVARRTGAAVVVLDHVVKTDESGLWPIGSQRKRAAVSGAQYMQTTVQPFARDAEGLARLICAKDRHGTYRTRQKVADLAVSIEAGSPRFDLRTSAEVSAGSPGDWRPTALMERVSRALEAVDEPLSVRALEDRVRGKKEHIKVAVRCLVDAGHVVVTEGPRRAQLHTLARPYAQRADPQSDLYSGGGTVSPDVDPLSASECPRPLEGGTGDTQSDRPRGTVGGQSGGGAQTPARLPLPTTADGRPMPCPECGRRPHHRVGCGWGLPEQEAS